MFASGLTMMIVSTFRLRLRVAFGVYSSLNVEGASESSESDSSSFLTLLFVILGGVDVDWWRYCPNTEDARSEPIDRVGEVRAFAMRVVSLEKRDVRIAIVFKESMTW